MSLTSFLRIKDVKEAFRREFKKPRLRLQGKLLAPPLTNHYGLVGTAFDYLLRFYVKYLNPNAIEKSWVSEASLYLLEVARAPELLETIPKDPIMQKLREKIMENPALSDPVVYEKVLEILRYARKVHDRFIKDGVLSSDVFKAVLLLAQVDVIYRAGVVDENLGSVDERDVEDLKNLISLVRPEWFKAKRVCILNPTFGEASQLVGGADCDLVIDDAIIEIKTTKRLELKREYFDQLIGYYILYRIGGIDGMPSDCEIRRLGIYFSRHAYFLFIDVQDVVNEETFPRFVEWFKRRASEEYGFRI
ncbi:MAG: hypothetical protein ACTSXX_01660 [Candidatus Baldrarchaeia archaeon]